MEGPYSIYLHIPFCQQRCGYCDFNTYAGQAALIEPYTDALCAEIAAAAAGAGARLPVHTVFFGGGTPSLLTAAQLGQIMGGLRAHFDVQPDAEITLEANPGTVTLDWLRAAYDLGVRRLSLGMQSANPQELRLLDRRHGPTEVINALKWAHQAGIENINLDLIFGLPEQSLTSFQRSLDWALTLSPTHLSLYALGIEEDTPLGAWAARGLVSLPDEDSAADMYEWAVARLAKAGFVQYEISNWANRPYFGFGAGAHGYVAGVRTANVLTPVDYIRRMRAPRRDLAAFPRTPVTVSAEIVTREAEIAETMMMGLRLTEEGVARTAFGRRFGEDLAVRFAPAIARLQAEGLLEWADERLADERLRLTPRGRLLGNRVFREFV
jgi:oxygen-independent coproporphyrinogen-3 oxidase